MSASDKGKSSKANPAKADVCKREAAGETAAPSNCNFAAELPPRTADDHSKIIANLTHELKTPLHSILAVSSLLSSEADGPLNSEQKRQVDIISRNGEHLLEMITDLLQFSSTTTESRLINIRRLNLVAVFEDCLRTIRPLAKRAGVLVETDFSDLEPKFFSDRTLLQRICGNLLANAVKFSPEGSIVQFFARTKADGELEIQISDSGIGMQPDVQQAVFSEFYQADSGDAKRYGGVGLGLALVRAALEKLSGKIDLKSESGSGTLFLLEIPSAEEAGVRAKILIVDRDPSVQLSLGECFRSEGFVTCFSDAGEQLVKEIAKEKPDLLMLDVHPKERGSGFELLKEIRSSSWGAAIPVILMSTVDAPGERARGFNLGASDFIVKPFDVAELLARVRAQLERPW